MDEALWRMAYPGMDPDACTASVYYGLLDRACRAKAILSGGGEESQRAEGVAKSNAEIIGASWFSRLFPGDE